MGIKEALIAEGKKAKRLSIVQLGNKYRLCYDRARLWEISFKTETQRRQALSLLMSLYTFGGEYLLDPVSK